MMRVLHVIPSLDSRSGGPSRSLLGFAPALMNAGVEVSVLAGWEATVPTENVQLLQEGGVEVRLVGPCRGPFKNAAGMASVVADLVASADVVHIHGVWESIQHHAATSARRLGKPYIIRPCGMLDPWPLSQGRLKKRLYMAWRLSRNLARAAALHATASLEAEGFRQLGLATPVIVEPNGLDLSEFSGIEDFPLPPVPDRYVLFLGRVHHKKGLDLLLRAFAELPDQHVSLVIAGDGDPAYLAELRSTGERLGIANRVVYTGHVEGPARLALMARAALFLLPSHQENFAIAAAEALAAGTPVLLSDQVGIAREVQEAGVGEMLPLVAAAWTDVLARRLSPESWQADVRTLAAGFARSDYDWRQIARRWVDHYARLCRP